jgi:hypothetical protein
LDVSYNWELNLSTNLEPTLFEEATSHDEWKESMEKEYDALINNGTWKLVDQTNRLQVGIQEQVQITWLTLQEHSKAHGKRICIERRC